MTPGTPGKLTYAASGVDIAAGEAAAEEIGKRAALTYGPEVLEGVGAFAGMFALGRYDEPVLVATTDGVGTKSMVATEARRLDTIGIDLVAMCVDDLVCQGAQPLFLLDYLATGQVRAQEVEAIVEGIVRGCTTVGCALLGGETAEHPGAMEPGQFDLAGFAVGVVERGRVLGASRVEPGDALVGIASPGLRCNGYSLARKVLLERAGLPLDGPAYPGSLDTLADELLRPSVIYAPAVLGLRDFFDVHAAAHVTGGGVPGNLARALPEGCDAVVDRSTWEVPRIFAEVQRFGGVEQSEMESVFNLGVGMVLVVAPSDAGPVVAALSDSGHRAMIVGEVVPGERRVRMTGRAPRG